MIDPLARSEFLRPRERLMELVALEHAAGQRGSAGGELDGLLDPRTLTALQTRLVDRGLLSRTSDGGTIITETGRTRLHYLLIDLVRDLDRLHASSRAIVQRGLAPLAADGLRSVAFYPAGETAEVAFPALAPLGLELVAVVDDNPLRWNQRFHHLRIRPPAALRDVRVDAIILTTVVFQERIREKLRDLGLESVRIHSL